MATPIELKQAADAAFQGILGTDTPVAPEVGSDTTVSGTAPTAPAQVDMPSVFDVADLESPEPSIPELPSAEEAAEQSQTQIDQIASQTQEATTQSIDDLVKGLETPTAAETERESLTGRLETALEDVTDRGPRLLEEEEKLGVQENIKKLQGLNQQIAQLQAGLDLGIAREEARPIARQFITGRVAEMRRQAAAEIGGLATVAQALQGNIELAQATAQRTIDLEFAPQEQEIANLKTLIDVNFQDLGRADKKRAEKLSLDLQRRQEKIDTEKAERQSVLDLAIDVAASGGSQEEVRQILSSKTLEDAVSVATPALGRPEPLSRLDQLNLDIKEVDLAQKLKDLTENKGLDSKTVNQIDSISKSFNNAPITKQFNDVLNKKLSVDAIVNAGVGGPGDLALVFEFMKALDPTSVVRESEYESAAKSGNIFAGAFTRFNKGYFAPEGGFLPEQVKQSFQDIVGKKFGIIERQYDNLRDETGRLINRKTGDTDGSDFLIDYKIDVSSNIQSLQDYVKLNPDQLGLIENILTNEPDLSDMDVLQLLQSPNNSNTAPEYLSSFGQVTGFGSPFWKHGLDVDLKVGDPVPTPITGKIVRAGRKGGFGNQVQVRADDGSTYWLSHLDNISVKVGDLVRAGDLVGRGGKTGRVIPVGGGDGSHLDITIQKADGTFVPPKQIFNLLV